MVIYYSYICSKNNIKGALEMKKTIYTAVLALCLSLVGISSSAFASEVLDEPKNSDKRVVGTEHPTPYSQITTYSNGSASEVDFSEATFYDEAGNVIEPPMDSNTDLVTPLGTGSSDGSWSSGSGYTCVTGVIVKAWYNYPKIHMSFKADFCINHGTYAYDNISKVYLPDMNVWDWEDLKIQSGSGSKETSASPASGGISAKVRRTEDSNSTLERVTLYVQNDRYWVDSTFK